MSKRPRDPNQLAKLIVDITTGEARDTESDRHKHPEKRQGRIGGLAGGPARAKALSAKKRSMIARKAARSRWDKEP